MKKMNDCVNIVNCDDIRYIQHDDGIGWDIFIKMELLTPLTKSLPEIISDDIVVLIFIILTYYFSLILTEMIPPIAAVTKGITTDKSI